MVTYQLAIFDFDGTLADSFPWFQRVLNDVARKFRFRPVEWSKAETELLRAKSAREIMQYLQVARWKVPLISWHMRSLMCRDRDAIQLFPGIDRMLRGLSERGVALAVVSSNSEENVRHVLGPDCATLVGDYACRASIFGKAAKIRAVLRRSRVPAAAAIYIGDEVRDGEAAGQAGVAFAAVAWGYTRVETLAALTPALMLMSVDGVADALVPPRSVLK